MADQSKQSEPAQNSHHQTIKFVTAVTIGAALLALSGLTLTATILSLIIVTPILVIFSPIVVPAGIAIFLATSGFLLSGALAAVAFTSLSWMYNYVSGKHPPGSARFDNARMRLVNKARDVKEKAKEYGQQVQDKVQEPKAQELKAQETKAQESNAQGTKAKETKAQVA